MSAGLEGFLLDTLLWTAGLIALVLLLRRVVARYLGPQAAYALWLLPVLRLVLPPLVLPAWLAPVTAVPDVNPTQTFEGSAMAIAASAPAGGEAMASGGVAPSLFETLVADWSPLVIALWLAGAGLFLAFRFAAYFRMRAEMLDGARPVGEAGRVRLVETPATSSPIAFGVLDRIIALPPGFMARADRTERDLALEHELAHHRAHDLLANFAVQPLFALHWFNPLGWYGWRALRHDQEAACDARVIARCGHEHRSAYAQVIASFAAGPAVALAAPMACPVIGEKSIIHRLRSLKMSEISPRRRLLSRTLIGAAVLALPLTASISYASDDDAPEQPVRQVERKLVIIDVPQGAKLNDPTLHAIEIKRDDGTTVVFKTRNVVTREEAEARVEAAIAGMPEPPHPPAPPEAAVAPNDYGQTRREHRIVINREHGEMTERERAALRRELRKEMREADKELREADREMRQALAEQRRAMIEIRNAQGERIRANLHCDNKQGNDKQSGASWSNSDGHGMVFCASQVWGSALEGLKQARNEVARSKDIPDDVRAELLRAFDAKIRNWNGS